MMRSKETIRFGVRHVSRFFVVGALAVTVAGCDGLLGRDEQQYVSRGLDYYQSGKFSESIIEFRNALQENPENAQARYYLGVARMSVGDYASARRDLERAGELGYSEEQLALPLAQARLAVGDFEAVLNTEPPDDISQADTAELYALRGRAALEMDDTAQAREEFRLALSADPGSASARFGQVLMASMDNDQDRMREWVERTLSADEDHPDAWRTRGLLHLAQGENDQAEEALTRTIEVSGSPRLQDLYQRAILRIQRGAVDEAREDAERLIEIAPDFAGGRYALGLVALREGDARAAQSEMEAALSRNGRFAPARLMLGVIHGDAGRYSQARYQLERYQVLVPDASVGSLMLAALEGRQGNAEASREKLDAHLQRHPQDRYARSLRASIERGDDAEPGMTQVAFSVMGGEDLSPMAAAANGEAAIVEAASDESGPSEEELQAVRNALTEREYNEALRRVEALIEEHPEVSALFNLKAGAHLAMGELQEGVDALARALEIDPGYPSAVRNLGQLLQRANREEDALIVYAQAHEANPDHLDMHLEYARLEYEVGSEERSNALVEDAIERHPDALEPRLIQARRLVGDGAPREALETIEPLLDEHSDESRLMLVQADAYEALDESAEAVRIWERLVDQQPENADLLTSLARNQAQVGDFADAEENLLAAIDAAPDRSEPRLLLVRVHMSQGDPASAETAYQELIDALGERWGFLQQGATVAFLNNEPDEALARLERAHEIAPGEHGARALAEGYQYVGREGDARQVLEDWYSEAGDNMSAIGRHQLAALRLQTGDEAQAAELYETMLAEEPDDPIMLNNLAWALRETDPRRAVTLAERAVGLAPDATDVEHTLAVALNRAGDHERAVEVMEQVVERDARPEYRLDLAELYVDAGEEEKAERLLLDLAEADDIEGASRARELLNELSAE